MRNRRSAIWKMPEKKFVSLVSKCTTYTEFLAHFGLMNRGNNHKTLKKKNTGTGTAFRK